MNAQDMRIIDAYENLINSYSPERSCAFLQACWLLDEGVSFQSISLSRMIFSEGNSQEVYTREERAFISSLVPYVDFACFQIASERGGIDCRVVAVDFGLSHDTIYDCIKFMKIFNKSFEGFNIFSFVCGNGLHLGCSCIKNHEHIRDCMLSPLIAPNINWEALTDVFLYRNEANILYDYYAGVLNTIYEIYNCFDCPENEDYNAPFSYYHGDDDPADCLGKVHLSEHINYIIDYQPIPKDPIFDAEQFESYVEECFVDLDYITTLKANPLEMLFDAEAALEQSNSLGSQNTETTDFASHSSTDNEYDENIELLNDPATLVKKLKTELVFN